jgi:hypothetical protein
MSKKIVDAVLDEGARSAMPVCASDSLHPLTDALVAEHTAASIMIEAVDDSDAAGNYDDWKSAHEEVERVKAHEQTIR